MMKHALIINPWVTDFKLYDEWMHPVGLYFLISLLKQNKWDVQYINCLERNQGTKNKRYNTGGFEYHIIKKPEIFSQITRKYKQYGISKEHLKRKLEEIPRPDIIFLGTSMTYWIDGVIKTCDVVREKLPQIPIVVGGIAARLIPNILRQKLPQSYIYPHQISSDLKKLPQLENITLKSWEPSCFDAFALQKTIFHGPLLTSFGCPFKCSYCASTFLQNKFYFRSQKTVINEIKFLVDTFNIKDFAFYDDALIYQADKFFFPFTSTLKKHFKDVRLHTPNGLNIAWLNNKNLSRMYDCGFVTLRFGYETGNKKLLKQTHCKTNREQLIEKINIVKSIGFQEKNIGVYIMSGLLNQTVEDVLEELLFVSSLNVMVKPVFLSPVPYTPLFNYYAKIFPLLKSNHHYHNDTFFITQLPGWDYSQVEMIKIKAREYNNRIFLKFNKK